ncbi:MAG: SDR family oxidoreductase [Alphaproteobacteria bacterium]|nr:SDR family oxidoreductase [Alphaproteobacteria bacterium]
MSEIAIVTGASRGIGRAVALKLAANGFDVCVNYCANESAALGVVAEIEALGQRAIAVRADVAVEADIVRMFEAVDERLGVVSALVNNAGIIQPQMSLVDMDAARVNKIMQINVTGTIICCREAAKRMSTDLGGVGGVIVNLSSAAAKHGSAGEYVDYAASKGAVDTLTKGIAFELALQGVRVNAVRPGIIDTEIHASGGVPDRFERMGAGLPMGRGGTPEEVADVICYLLSDAASYVTATIVDVAGGR